MVLLFQGCVCGGIPDDDMCEVHILGAQLRKHDFTGMIKLVIGVYENILFASKLPIKTQSSDYSL